MSWSDELQQWSLALFKKSPATEANKPPGSPSIIPNCLKNRQLP